ncbi:MAG: hypothetical protein C5B56_01015 [Proteobacteria bacterium]|nr:MAG: hypothetical protein C5B56_01015 [Pseudomonadota bacterium]
MSTFRIARISVAAGLALALAGLVLGSATAAPVSSITAEVKSAVATSATEVRWRRYRWRRYGGYSSGCHIAGGYHRPNGCW